MRRPTGRRRIALLRAARDASSWAELLAAKTRIAASFGHGRGATADSVGRSSTGGGSCPPHSGEGALRWMGLAGTVAAAEAPMPGSPPRSRGTVHAKWRTEGAVLPTMA